MSSNNQTISFSILSCLIKMCKFDKILSSSKSLTKLNIMCSVCVCCSSIHFWSDSNMYWRGGCGSIQGLQFDPWLLLSTCQSVRKDGQTTSLHGSSVAQFILLWLVNSEHIFSKIRKPLLSSVTMIYSIYGRIHKSADNSLKNLPYNLKIFLSIKRNPGDICL